MVDLILIFLLCIGNQIYVDLIGHLSVSDLFIIGFGIVYVLVNRGLGKFANDKEIPKPMMNKSDTDRWPIRST